MIKQLFLFLLLTPYFAEATALKISNIHIRRAFEENYPSSIYLNIDNQSNELYYLLSVEILDHPAATTKISKTVIEKNIARIITIDRLAIPAKMEVKLVPLGIFIMVKNLPNLKLQYQNPLKIKFIFNNNLEIIEKFS